MNKLNGKKTLRFSGAWNSKQPFTKHIQLQTSMNDYVPMWGWSFGGETDIDMRGRRSYWDGGLVSVFFKTQTLTHTDCESTV